MKWLIVLPVFLAFALPSFSQDRVFAYTYETNVLNKGDIDIEFQNTLRTGKTGVGSPYSFGQHLDQRLELEYGLGHRMQTAFYLNSELFNYSFHNSKEIEQELSLSFISEWKWKITDPVADRFGTGLYGELEFGGRNIEIEGKLILDKKLPNDLFAMNLIGRYEIERENSLSDDRLVSEWAKNSAVEIDAGYAHFLNPNFSVGLEAKDVNEIGAEKEWQNSVLFLGPSVHVVVGKCCMLFTAMPQIANLHKTANLPEHLDLINHEKLEVRLVAGLTF